jgi:hypothetical protein
MPDNLQAIRDLVARYQHNDDLYRRPAYNEAQVRTEFIDPLFIALGWDVHNEQGRSPRYRDVVHEASLRQGGSVKAPDYAFCVGPERKFFVEAKKPAVDIHSDPSPAYQLRRYAWTARLPLSILTNFRQLAVYDCRVRPKAGDDAASARVLYLEYDEYPQRWDEIADVFVRDAVWGGDFDRYAESEARKRGTQTVDDAFLAEIEEWRVLLARNIALRNPGLRLRDLNYAVQQTIDRLIFLRITEDRGIEPYGQLRDALDGAGVYPRLVTLFQRADDRYNSGLFHFGREAGREQPDLLTPGLAIDDKGLAQIIGTLYYPECPYAFEALGVDILGSIYERFLGSVIRLTSAGHAKVEPKPEVRKAGGVYYTPRYIVDYIVEHTVGALVAGKSPGQIADLRVLDPACGSGSFLLGAYQYLLDWYLEWYTGHPTARPRREIYQGAGGEWFLTTDEKKRILLAHIYGVDIDPQAVEVTKLSLLLKVLEGESAETLAAQREMWQERALPDLATNIKCGNSLIGPEFYHGQQGTLFDDEEFYRINAFDWQAAFPETMARGGFDAVIGNPPYIRIQTLKEWAPREVEYYKGRYTAASKGNYDIYVVFVEKGLELLNDAGRLGYILPHKFLNAQYGQPLRQRIAQGHHLAEVVHFGDQQVFEGATTYTCLLFLAKGGAPEAHVQKVTDLEAWIRKRQATAGNVPAARITEAEWNLVIGPGADLFHRLQEMPVKLEDVASRIFQGLITGRDSVFILLAADDGFVQSDATGKNHRLEPDLLHPLCKGSVDIRRYHVGDLRKRILFPYRKDPSGPVLIPQDEFSARYPNTWRYLSQCRGELEARERGKWRHGRWYAYSRSQNLDQMDQPKVLTPSIAQRPSFTFDSDGELYLVGSGGGGGGGYGITLAPDTRIDYRYVLGLLNSALMRFYVTRVSSTFRGGYYAFNRQYIEGFPIRTIAWDDPADVARHDRMVAMVQQMLDLHRRLAAANVPHQRELLQRQIAILDDQIDALVYELYELTEVEIATIT